MTQTLEQKIAEAKANYIKAREQAGLAEALKDRRAWIDEIAFWGNKLAYYESQQSKED